ncbi:MAG: PDZ domain-containing protein [Planctomycetota bacterium]
MTRRTLGRSFVSASVLAALAGTAIAQDGPARLLRQPSASDRHVVFAHANDIWIADRDGGEARRLTTFEGAESDPHLSPDGNLVAFTGEYDGNVDVYVVPVEGGSPERLTWHPGGDSATGWTPDGRVMFSSGRDRAPVPYPRFFTMGLDDVMPEPLPLPRVASGKIDPESGLFAYQETRLGDIEWRNYRGGQAKPIWVTDFDDLEITKLPWNGSVDTDPVWIDGDIYFLSDRDYAVNLYKYDTDTKELEQLTEHTEFDAKNIEAGGGVLVYELGGFIHMYDPARGYDQRLDITLRGDFPTARPRFVDAGNQIRAGAISPTGKRGLFQARGEIFTVPVEDGDIRNLSQSPGSREIAPAWAPNGKDIAYFSDASGEYQLHIASQDGLEEPRVIEIPNPTYFYDTTWSPDSSKIAFTDESRTLWICDAESGELTRVDGDSYAVPARTVDPVWSPDSKWIAYAKRLDSQLRAVFAYSLEAGESFQLTDGLSDASDPAWDASGKYLYFLASTNTGLTAGWLDMTSYDKSVTRGAYLIVLADDEPSPLLPKSDDEEEKVETNDDTEDKDNDKKDDDKDKDKDDGVRIDMKGIDQRVLALPVPQRNYTDLKTGDAGKVFMLEQSYDVGARGQTLHRFDMNEREASEVMSGIGGFEVSHDGKKLLYAGLGNRWGIIGAGGKESVGQGSLATSRMRFRLDPKDEWQQIYREAWRLHRDFFYVDNLHGADWDAVYDRYLPIVEHVKHRSDLTHLIDIVGGEISVGHSFTRGGDTPNVDRVQIGMLGADYEIDRGRYRVTKIYRGENWNPNLRAPLTVPGVNVEEGDFILAVDGVELDDSMSIYEAFEGLANRQVTLTVNDRPRMRGARTVQVTPVSSEFALRQREWMESNRKTVDILSGGRLAYAWLPNTGQGGYTNFNRYFIGQQDRRGAIVDERFNGGGSAADYMVDIMNRDLTGFFNNPIGDRTMFTNPQVGIFGPKVLIINEAASSGGDLLPYMFKTMEIGPLVGTRTWGGLIGIWDYPPLIDGGTITVPRGGFLDADGEWRVENEGVGPDIYIEMEPKAYAEGRDPQLEAAIYEALRLLEEGDWPTIHTEPEGPIRAVRPGDPKRKDEPSRRGEK